MNLISSSRVREASTVMFFVVSEVDELFATVSKISNYELFSSEKSEHQTSPVEVVWACKEHLSDEIED